MSVVTIQLGQCGNQVGAELFKNLASAAACEDDYSPAGPVACETFFRQQPSSVRATGDGCMAVARAVMIDMEPKVIQETLERVRSTTGVWQYPNDGYYAKAGGSGNNWALGYAVHGPAATEAVLDKVRVQQ